MLLLLLYNLQQHNSWHPCIWRPISVLHFASPPFIQEEEEVMRVGVVFWCVDVRFEPALYIPGLLQNCCWFDVMITVHNSQLKVCKNQYRNVYLIRSLATAVTWESVNRIPSKVFRDTTENLVYILMGMTYHEEAEMDLWWRLYYTIQIQFHTRCSHLPH